MVSLFRCALLLLPRKYAASHHLLTSLVCAWWLELRPKCLAQSLCLLTSDVTPDTQEAKVQHSQNECEAARKRNDNSS
jgi:hypothetical protein